MIDWPKEIAILTYVKDEIFKIDSDNLWRHHLPKVAVSSEQLHAAASAIGHPLDPSYTAFLRHANGWPAFYQNVDLFGTNELLGGELMDRAMSALSAMAHEAFSSAGVRQDELLPIAVSSSDLDLFVMMRPGTQAPGTIIWFAGMEVERFPNFDEFFLAMADYNRLDYQNLQRDVSD
jgi:hypothetical protein